MVWPMDKMWIPSFWVNCCARSSSWLMHKPNKVGDDRQPCSPPSRASLMVDHAELKVELATMKALLEPFLSPCEEEMVWYDEYNKVE